MIALKVSVTQSCLTLCDPMDCSSLGSSVHRILQAKCIGVKVLPLLSPGDLSNAGVKPGSPKLHTVLYHPATKEAHLNFAFSLLYSLY